MTVAHTSEMNAPYQRFNDDLLIDERDRDLARNSFPDILHVLDFPQLREMISSYDIPANRAKRRRGAIGCVAIFIGAIALLGASFALSSGHSGAPWAPVLALVSAVLGVVSLVLGSVGTLTGASKQRWLCGRLMTERLRQFQFQTFVCRLPEILESTRKMSAAEAFVAARLAWFGEFRLAYEGHLGARLTAVLEDDAEEHFWLHPDGALQDVKASDPAVKTVFAAYRLLRLEHQIQYANYRLGENKGSILKSATLQLEVLRNAALLCTLVACIANLGLAAAVGLTFVLGHFPVASVPGAEGILTPAHIAIIWLFIGIVAIRTLEEGLQPAREVERYRHYRSTMLALLKRFDRAADPREKLATMRDAERAAYQEMRAFFRTHSDAKYVL